ncbi:hypothetical protein FRC17_001093 [Serendipita sp. 399]|nr:hypothetical protein FRC17_001093 [Serendipita sp. 399]
MTNIDLALYPLLNPGFLGDKIEDVEEELFLLYTRRASFRSEGNNDGGVDPPLRSILVSDTGNGSALGLVDQRNDHIELQFTFPNHRSSTADARRQPKASRKTGKLGNDSKRRGEGEDRKRTDVQLETIDITLAQDITGLRSRVGDTESGGGVWRGSVLLAQALLTHFHQTAPDRLFDPVLLKNSHVLELGAGTGLLGLILGPLVAQWTCTDLPEMIPLIRKNLALNQESTFRQKGASSNSGKLNATPLDWNTVHECTPAARRRLFPLSDFGPTGSDLAGVGDKEERIDDGIDLIVAVDCVYNPSLIPPLLTTIDHFSSSNKTITLVVMELRDDEVVRQLLTQWSAMSTWEIWRVGNDVHPALLDERFVIWAGMKGSSC